MKAILFIILATYYLCNAENKVYTLFKYDNLTFINKDTIFIALDCSDITGNEIYITLINHNESFIDDKFYYNFTDEYPNNDFKTTKMINSYSKEKLVVGEKLFYKIKKESAQYLVFKNVKCNENNTIEIENTETIGNTNVKSNSSIVIVIALVSVTLVVIILVTFILVGKYIYNKRQKEIMANYASSFVDDTNKNPSLIPDDKKEQEQEQEQNINVNKND